jgi:RND family efflux transporter MFP subunit
MSDMLQANQDQPEVKDVIIMPTQDEKEVEDAIRFEPLFQDDEEDSTYAAPPGRRRRVWFIALSVVLVLLVIGGGVLIYARRANASQVQYSTSTVAYGNLTQTVSASGPLQAKAEYDMNFNTSGQVNAIDVHVGQQVKAGQVLATLNAPNLQIAVEQAQITVDNAQQTYDTAVNNGDAQTTLNTDYNSLQSAQLQLQTAQNGLAAATLTAPAKATVAAINGVVGQIVGSSSSSAFIVLVDTSGYNITASVNEADVSKVQINQPVRFTLAAYPSQVFRATVSSINMIGTTSSGVVTYPVNMVVTMSNIGNAHFYPGMTATVNITTAQRIGALLVSNNALTFITTALQAGVISRSALTQISGNSALRGNGGQNTSNSRVVLVLRNGQLVPALVTVGLSNGIFSEVLSGLNQGDQVVVGATGGAFANLSTGSSTNGGSFLRTGGGGGGFGGGTRTGAGG